MKGLERVCLVGIGGIRRGKGGGIGFEWKEERGERERKEIERRGDERKRGYFSWEGFEF